MKGVVFMDENAKDNRINDSNNSKNNSDSKVFIRILVISLLITFAFNVFSVVMTARSQSELEYSKFIKLVQEGKVESVEFQSDKLIVKPYKDKLEDGDQKLVNGATVFYTGRVGDDELVKLLKEKNVEFYAPIQYNSPIISFALSWILPLLIMYLGFTFIMRLMAKHMGGGLGGFGKSNAKVYMEKTTGVTFADVAGQDEAKESLQEIIDFLHNPTKYNKIGAKQPKGALLVGPPGTGKTLLAKAVAGEAKVTFMSLSGSDFEEMFVGVGASRVRDLFEQAKKNAPCLVFIDEIDAVGRRRGAGLGGGHDEREQTLNQLLVEMDGFGVNQGVIVMAATNRPDILDPALLRPGRFDRQVVVGAPDAKGREEILQVHARGKKLAPDVDLKDIANTTQGFTGADLENLLNEAALHAARKNKKEISMQDIKDSFIRVALGTEKKSHIKTELERKITAYHEAGHAILFEKMPDLSPVHTVSIIPIGMAGGYTMPVPTEKSFRFKRSMEQEIVATFGGRVAEEMIFGDYTQGASKDIEQATNLARNMVTRFGMSEKMGPILYGEEDHEVFLGRDIGHSRNYGENVAGQIDSEIRRIIDEAYNKAKEVLEENRDGLERTAQLLLKKEKVSGDEFREVLNNETVEEPQETVVIDSEHFNAENSEN